MKPNVKGDALKVIKLFVPLVAVFWGGTAMAKMDMQTIAYSCDRGAAVSATYINSDDESLVVLQVEGRQIGLRTQPAASGARYAVPDGQPGYEWWGKGNESRLSWIDGDQEVVIFESCLGTPQP